MAEHLSSRQIITGFQRQRDLLIDLALLSYFLVLIKWSFYITDISISFMYPLTGWKKIEILLAGGLALTLFNWAAQFIFSLFAAAVEKPLKRKGQFLIFLVRSLVETLITIIVVDNFTYTVFHFGILTVSQPVMAIYTLLFVGTFGVTLWLHIQHSRNPENKPRSKWWTITTLTIVGFSLLCVAFTYFTSPVNGDLAIPVEKSEGTKRTPNIIILGSDGINAKNMSVYGYGRQTTPFLDAWVKDCLISENNFTNANKSMGSDTALLTGKSPLHTHVIFSPDILRGEDVAEHLPGLLKDLGYTTMQQGFPYYVDSGTTNLQNGFDQINFVEQTTLAYSFNKFFDFRLTDEVYLVSAIAESVTTKVKTLFFLIQAQNPYDSLIDTDSFSASDHEKLDSLYAALAQSKTSRKPLFAHFHLMITHGEDFITQSHVFSAGETQDREWMEDFYDDAILDYDGYVRDLVAYLKQIGEYDNTIIVLYTDHPQQWQINERIPLIIHFPGDAHAGVVTTDTQNMDIAPTILDSLGETIPSWMEGNSLLEPISNKRIIFTAESDKLVLFNGQWAVFGKMIEPPFYQFSQVNIFQCQNIYSLNLDNQSMALTTVEDYPNPCPQSELPGEDEIREELKQLLISYGYELPADWK
jgi:arylsulfatase A-like enzyme